METCRNWTWYNVRPIKCYLGGKILFFVNSVVFTLYTGTRLGEEIRFGFPLQLENHTQCSHQVPYYRLATKMEELLRTSQ